MTAGRGSFGELLRGLRVMAGVTQDELAERAGVSVRGLRYLEQGSRRPYPDTIRRVADALHVSATDREALVVAARSTAPAAHATAGRRGGYLPVPSSPLIGRDAELATVERLVRRDDVRAVTITGPGGVGKTRLAIEAATRMRDGFREPLSPQAMLERLRQQRLPFLTGGVAGSPARQATLRATVEWSHDLLDPVGQVVFRRLAVFHGGCTLAAAEAVIGGPGQTPDDVLDAVENLQRSSLLTVSDPHADDGGHGDRDGRQLRLSMLDTIREYGMDRLRASDEYPALAHAHAKHFVTVAEGCAEDFYTPRAGAAITRLDDDIDNLRAALRRCARTGDADLAIRLVAALWTFWYVRGHLGEGRASITAVLQSTPEYPACRPLAQALLGAGQLALAQGDYPEARTLIDRSIAMHRGLDDARGTAEGLLAAGFATRLNDEPDTAQALLDEARILATAADHPFVVGAALHHLGMLATTRGDHAEGRRLLEESLACYRQLQLHRFIALVTLSLGELALASGDTPTAREHFCTSLAGMLHLHAILDLPVAYESHADLAAASGDLTRAVRLAAAAAHQRTVTGSRPWPDTQRRRDQWLAAARTRLGDAAFTAAWADGQHMSIEAATADTQANLT